MIGNPSVAIVSILLASSLTCHCCLAFFPRSKTLTRTSFPLFALRNHTIEIQRSPVVESAPVSSIENWSQNIDLRRALTDYGSNVWIISEEQLEKNCQEWVDGVANGKSDNIWFPVKANPSPAILEILAKAGIGAECSSAAEVHLASRAGFPNEKVMYNSPAPNAKLAREILLRAGNLVIDSVAFLQEMDELMMDASTKKLGKILLRVNPSVNISYKKGKEYSDLTAHADVYGKFGIPSEDIIDALRSIRSLKIDGLHVHVGTQMDFLEPFVIVGKHLQELAVRIAMETDHKPKILDLGGGLGIPFSPDDDFPSINAFAERIHREFTCDNEFKFDYWFEPGHALVGNTVGLLGKIVAKKTMRGRDWVIADIGFDQVMKISLLGWTHPVLGPDGSHLPKGQGSVGGPLCFAGDIVLQGTDVSALKRGEPIFIQHTGAYCGSCANTFNGRRSGGTVVLKKDGVLKRVCPPASVEDEPLANMYSWGSFSSVQEDTNQRLVDFRTDQLSSDVLTKHVENFSYLNAFQVGPSTFEYTIHVDNEVTFCSMPLLSRIAADACIVSILRALGKASKEFPIWGKGIRMNLNGIVSSRKPLHLKVELSSFERASSGLVTNTMKFDFNNGETEGTFETSFKEMVELAVDVTESFETGARRTNDFDSDVMRLIAEAACVSLENINNQSLLVNDLNLDSIDIMEIHTNLEEIDIFLAEEQLFQCESVEDILQLVVNYKKIKELKTD